MLSEPTRSRTGSSGPRLRRAAKGRAAVAPRVFLIDGTAFCYRAFYALAHLSTSTGRPTNAVYGFVMMLKALQEKERPDYLAVAFDVGKPTFRHQQFKAYKAQRKPMPEALIGQLPLIKQVLTAYRIPVFEREGFEAEDVLATITRQIADGRMTVFLVTGDKDLLQLVNAHVQVYNPYKAPTVMDAAAVRERYGIGPEHMVDLLALMGDAADNIPGVPGIKERTAVQLLQRFGSVDGVYAHLQDVDHAGQRRALAASKAQVDQARELARIDAQVPVAVRLDDLKAQEPDWTALRSLFRELEFKRLLREAEAHSPAPEGPVPAVRLLERPEELAAFCDELERHRPAPAAVLCWPAGAAEVLAAVALTGEASRLLWLNAERLQSAGGRRFAAWLADAQSPKIGHDAKASARALRAFGLPLDGLFGDTMLAAYLLNPSRTNQMLSDLADEQLQQPLPALPSLDDGRPLVDDSSQLLPFGRCACAVVALHERLWPQLQATNLAALYTEVELPLTRVLARMEADGIAVDVPYLERLKASMAATLQQLTEELYRLAGCSFNLNSPRQLAQVLFERLQLPVIKRTKTGPSTDSDVLQQLAERHPLPRQLMRYRELSKLVSTYVDALPKLVDPRTGRLHTTFNQAATATGRLSSSEPNLQNIPIKTELGRSIRKAFVAGTAGGVLLAADYSQIELRILAHLSGDEQLTAAFREGRDIHRFTASLIYGLPEDEVQPEQRNAMKAINYGILYGMTSHGLSKELGVPFEEAQAFIDAYFTRYPKVRGYLDSQIAHAKRDGFVQTLLGRRRYIPEVNSPDLMIRQFGERMAVNAPIQGTAADLIKRAMVQLAHRMAEERLASRMVLQVHDELVFDAPRRELERLIPLVRAVMEGAIALDVPLLVTVKAGPNWLELAPVRPASGAA